jgi:hypothetical protein
VLETRCTNTRGILLNATGQFPILIYPLSYTLPQALEQSTSPNDTSFQQIYVPSAKRTQEPLELVPLVS